MTNFNKITNLAFIKALLTANNEHTTSSDHLIHLKQFYKTLWEFAIDSENQQKVDEDFQSMRINPVLYVPYVAAYQAIYANPIKQTHAIIKAANEKELFNAVKILMLAIAVPFVLPLAAALHLSIVILKGIDKAAQAIVFDGFASLFKQKSQPSMPIDRRTPKAIS